MRLEVQKWTAALKRKARKELTEIYNLYENKKVKFVKNVIFNSNGRAQKIGFAHDYSYWAW